MLKKILYSSFIIITSVLYSQDISQKFTSAMELYYGERYTEAYKMFKSISREVTKEDELYAASKFYAADALIKLGEKDMAVAELEYLVNHIIWSNFREEAFYNLGLIYYDFKEYSLVRARFKSLLKEYPASKYSGSALYWIGESYAAENKLQDAVDFLQKAINDNASNRYKDYSIYTLATVYERKEDYKNAVKYYDQLLSYYPNSKLVVSAQIRIGICYFYLKDYQSSILELKNPMLNSLPGSLFAESLYLLANSYYRVGQYADAEKVYNEILEKYPDADVFQDARYGLAWSLFQQNKYNDAYRVFDFLSSGTDSIAIESFYWKGEAKRYLGKNDEAIQIYKELLTKFPSSYIVPRVESQLGVLYFNQKDLNLSKQYLITALSSGNDDVKGKAYTLLGEIELNNKQYASAKNYFEPALTIPNSDKNNNLRAMLGMGSALYFLGDYDKSIRYLNEIFTKSPDFERNRVNYYLAENYFAKQNYKRALERYNAINTDDADITKVALYGSAYCYFNLGDYENAAIRFSSFIKTYPNDQRATDSHLRLADSYFGSKNFSAASQVYEQLFQSRQLSTNDPYAYYQYAQALYKSGKTESAINEFANLQRNFPRSKYGDVSLYTIGWINFQQDKFETAIDRYRNVLDVYPGTDLAPIIYYSIGDAYFNLSSYDNAIDNYQKVLSQYPSSDYIFDAVNGIQYCYVAKNQPEKAISLIDEFIARNPSLKFSDQIYFKKGELYYSQRDYENAKISYQDFLNRYKNSKFVPEAYYWIGKSAANLGENEQAIYNFNTLLQKYPEKEVTASAVLEMGTIYNNMKNYNLAINTYNEALQKLKGSPSLPEIMFNKGTTYINADSVQQAYDVFSDVVYYYRESIFADKSKLEMGMIDLAAGRFENSDKYFMEISGNRSDEIGAQAQYYYGLSLYQQNKFQEAISSLVRVRTVFSSYDEWLTKSYLLLGDCYVKLKDNRKAEEMYHIIISKHRNDKYTAEAREKLRSIQ